MTTYTLATAIHTLAQLDVEFACKHPGPSGMVTIPLSARELRSYVLDPVAYLARHYGVSVDDYLEWHRSQFTVRCSGTTLEGARCKGLVAGGHGVQPATWASMKGLMCPKH